MVLNYYWANSLGYLVAGCLSGDTQVHIGYSDVVPIRELAKLNQLTGGGVIYPVKSFNAETKTTELRPGVVIDSGVKQTYRVSFEDGTHIDVSGEQRFLARRSDGSFALEAMIDLTEGDEIVVSRARPSRKRVAKGVKEVVLR